MTENESIALINNRLKQLEDEVSQRSKHKNPMYYAAVNNLRWCSIVLTLMEGDWPEDSEIEAVCGIKAERTSTTQRVNLASYIKEGANVMDILNKYRDTVPDIHDKLKQAVTAAGFTINGFYIVKK